MFTPLANFRRWAREFYSPASQPTPQRREGGAPLGSLDAIQLLHRQAGGDFFLLNHIAPAPPPEPSPAIKAEPYTDHQGRIFIPAVPLHDI